MSVRVAAIFIAGLFIVGCAPEMAAAPPPASGVATVAAVPVHNVPANRWRAVLIAGDNSSPAFDNGIESLRERLTAAGVRDIKLLSADPQRVAGRELASSANVRTAVKRGGGAACLFFVTTPREPPRLFPRSHRPTL